jgi:hypothetical protein
MQPYGLGSNPNPPFAPKYVFGWSVALTLVLFVTLTFGAYDVGVNVYDGK